MIFNDDIESIRTIWGELSLISKLIIGASFIITFLSFTSLADSVFELKGFIVNAIIFYRWITDPILNIAKSLNIDVTRMSFDGIILVLIYTRGMYNNTAGLGMKTLGFFYLYILCPGLILVFMFIPSKWAFITVLLMTIDYFFRIITAFILSGKFDPNHKVPVIDITLKQVHDKMLESILQFLFPIVLVGIIAAISEGITRPL